MQATLSTDGQYRIELRITHRVGVGELSSILASAYRLHSLEDGPLPTLTAKAAQTAIRYELITRGGLIEGWSDGFGTTETNQRLAWAEEQVRRAYPELVRAEPIREPVADIAPAETPAPCKHGRTPRPDVTGDPVAACAASNGGTEWGAFNAEGCTYAYDCAVDVANESAKENEEAESTPDDPESTWGEMCRNHRDQEQPKDACEECTAETDEDEN